MISAAHRIREEDGRVTVLAIGMLVLLVAVIAVQTAIAAAEIGRVRMLGITDELAVSAVQELFTRSYYIGADAAVNQQETTEHITKLAHSLPAEQLGSLRAFQVVSVNTDGGVITVRAQAEIPLPWMPRFLDAALTMPITVESSAHAAYMSNQ